MKNDEVFLGEPTLRQMNREIEALAAMVEALGGPQALKKVQAIAKAKVTREANKTNEEESADK